VAVDCGDAAQERFRRRRRRQLQLGFLLRQVSRRQRQHSAPRATLSVMLDDQPRRRRHTAATMHQRISITPGLVVQSVPHYLSSLLNTSNVYQCC